MPKKLVRNALRVLLFLTIFIGIAKQVKMAALSTGQIFTTHEDPSAAYYAARSVRVPGAR